jgi:hypothetical protein
MNDASNNNITNDILNRDNNDDDDDLNLLSGDNKVDVEIEPDVKSNKVNIHIQFCSLSVFLNCFSKISP